MDLWITTTNWCRWLIRIVWTCQCWGKGKEGDCHCACLHNAFRYCQVLSDTVLPLRMPNTKLLKRHSTGLFKESWCEVAMMLRENGIFVWDCVLEWQAMRHGNKLTSYQILCVFCLHYRSTKVRPYFLIMLCQFGKECNYCTLLMRQCTMIWSGRSLPCTT